MKHKFDVRNLVLILISLFVVNSQARGAEGTKGAAFLDIPVGAEPAAMGAAYTALAKDAYAPVWNPAGLAQMQGTEITGQHLSYLESINYEFLGAAHHFGKESGKSLGASIQYLSAGDLTGRDIDGNETGDFHSYYSAYSLAYGQVLSDRLSLGVTGKAIQAKIDDVSAHAFATDLGAFYKLNDQLTLAGTLVNMGTKMKFIDQADSLPMAGHLGAAYRPNSQWLISSEAVYRAAGLASFHMGTQWEPISMLALRLGYRTDTLKGLSPIAGLSTGLGIRLWGQELSYAWVPYGDLGSTQYLSMKIRFGAEEEERRQMIQHQQVKKHRTVRDVHTNQKKSGNNAEDPEYMYLMQLLTEEEQGAARTAKHK